MSSDNIEARVRSIHIGMTWRMTASSYMFQFFSSTLRQSLEFESSRRQPVIFLSEHAVPGATPEAVLNMRTFPEYDNVALQAGFAATSTDTIVCRELEDERSCAIAASYHIDIARSW